MRARLIEPIDVVHLAHNDEFVAIGADRAVIVETVTVVGVTADHVGWFKVTRVTELWMPPRPPVVSGPAC